MIILSGAGEITSLTTPEAEFDGRNLTGADGSTITTWPDSSGNERDGTAGPDALILKTNILNGHSVARWTGAITGVDFTNTTNPVSFTIIAVVKCLDSAGRTVLSEGSNGFNAPVFLIDANKMKLIELGIADVGVSNTALNTTDFYTVAVTYDDSLTSYAFYLNGSADGSGSYNASWGRAFGRVGLKGGNLNRFLGDIAYVAFWHSVLSGTELTSRFNNIRTIWAHY